ncbi:Uncharacterised protein [Mycobacteroides abscessus subsp. massiliense]|nr:Uncharacterised protein [Mycobacteroides abscessus subsp. massiliense]SKL95640.1 Uncharacterised protein [Mycobacteroides abscessus subsp. massiliense]SKM77174.1 Uncharacterised protein [Mycobacteroides abscessus subsp. massiliense]
MLESTVKHVAVDGHDEEIPADPDVQAGLACLAIGLQLAYESDRSLFDGMSASPNSLANRHSDALGTLGDIGVMRDMCPSGNRSREIPGLTPRASLTFDCEDVQSGTDRFCRKYSK